MKRLLKIAIACLLLPACFAQGYTFYQSLRALKHFEGDTLFFLYGMLAYLILHTLLFKPTFLYVLGHEMIHALAGLSIGGKVGKVKVGKKEGQVQTSKSNAFVDLAPYFTPIYALMLCLVSFFAIRLFKIQNVQDLFFFLIGFFLTFHIVMTVEYLKTKQPDLVGLGGFLSLELIFLGNLLVIMVVLGFVFPEVSPKDYFLNAVHATGSAYRRLYTQLFL